MRALVLGMAFAAILTGAAEAGGTGPDQNNRPAVWYWCMQELIKIGVWDQKLTPEAALAESYRECRDDFRAALVAMPTDAARDAFRKEAEADHSMHVDFAKEMIRLGRPEDSVEMMDESSADEQPQEGRPNNPAHSQELQHADDTIVADAAGAPTPAPDTDAYLTLKDVMVLAPLFPNGRSPVSLIAVGESYGCGVMHDLKAIVALAAANEPARALQFASQHSCFPIHPDAQGIPMDVMTLDGDYYAEVLVSTDSGDQSLWTLASTWKAIFKPR